MHVLANDSFGSGYLSFHCSFKIVAIAQYGTSIDVVSPRPPRDTATESVARRNAANAIQRFTCQVIPHPPVHVL